MPSKLVRGGVPGARPVVWRAAGESQGRSATLAPQGALSSTPVTGVEDMAERLDLALGRLARSVQEISGLRQQRRREAEEDVVKLSIAIARRILNRELTLEPAAILGLVKTALDKLDAREVQTVRVHPEHVAILQDHLERLGFPPGLRILRDPTLERGAALLETRGGLVDASAHTQLEEIERGFSDLIRQTP